MNSSDESSMGSAVYFSNSVFTENLCVAEREGAEAEREALNTEFGCQL